MSWEIIVCGSESVKERAGRRTGPPYRSEGVGEEERIELRAVAGLKPDGRGAPTDQGVGVGEGTAVAAALCQTNDFAGLAKPACS